MTQSAQEAEQFRLQVIMLQTGGNEVDKHDSVQDFFSGKTGEVSKGITNTFFSGKAGEESKGTEETFFSVNAGEDSKGITNTFFWKRWRKE